MSIPLTCAYTEKTVTVDVIWHSGVCLGARVAGAWSPNRTFKDESEARLQMRRRGAKWIEPDAPLVCPYTGEPVRFQKVTGGVRPAGMLDTDRIFENVGAAVYAMSMRGGKADPRTLSPTASVEVCGEQLPEESSAAQTSEPAVSKHQLREIVRRRKTA